MDEDLMNENMREFITTYSPIKKRRSLLKSMKYKIRKTVLCSHPNKAHKVSSADFPLTPPPYTALDPAKKIEKFPLPFTSNRDYFDSLKKRESQRYYSYSVQESFSARSCLIPTDRLRSSDVKQRRTRPYSCSDLLDKRVTFEDEYPQQRIGINKTLPNMAIFDESDYSNDEMFYKPPAYLSPGQGLPDHFESLKRREQKLRSKSEEELSRQYRLMNEDENNNSSSERCFVLHGLKTPPRSVDHTPLSDDDDPDIHGRTYHREHRSSLPYFTVYTYDGPILYKTEEESENESNTSQSQLLHPGYHSDERSTSLYETSDDDLGDVFLPGLESIASSTISLNRNIHTIYEDRIEEIRNSDKWMGNPHLSGDSDFIASSTLSQNKSSLFKCTEIPIQKKKFHEICPSFIDEALIGETKIVDQETSYAIPDLFEKGLPQNEDIFKTEDKRQYLNDDDVKLFDKKSLLGNDITKQDEICQAHYRKAKNLIHEEPLNEVFKYDTHSINLNFENVTEKQLINDSEIKNIVNELFHARHIGTTYVIPIINPLSIVSFCRSVGIVFITLKIEWERGERKDYLAELFTKQFNTSKAEGKHNTFALWDHTDKLDHDYVNKSDWLTREQIQPIMERPVHIRNGNGNKFEFVLRDFQNFFCGMNVVTDKNVLLKNRNIRISVEEGKCKSEGTKDSSYISDFYVTSDSSYKYSKNKKIAPQQVYTTFCTYDVTNFEKRSCSTLHLGLMNGRLPPVIKSGLSFSERAIKLQYKC